MDFRGAFRAKETIAAKPPQLVDWTLPKESGLIIKVDLTPKTRASRMLPLARLDDREVKH
jgi:hypothetical protein